MHARDAMSEGRTLSLSTTDQVVVGEAHRSGVAPGKYICLEVSNAGAGMVAATLARENGGEKVGHGSGGMSLLRAA